MWVEFAIFEATLISQELVDLNVSTTRSARIPDVLQAVVQLTKTADNQKKS